MRDSDSPTCVLAQSFNNFGSEDFSVRKTSLDRNSTKGRFDESDTPTLNAAFASSISPKDLIRVVGQQRFWKARSVILRQWRIFSHQIFELHKLIKVQHLLAEMPNELFDGVTSFGTLAVMPDCHAGVCGGDMTKQVKHVEKKQHSSQKDEVTCCESLAVMRDCDAGVCGGDMTKQVKHVENKQHSSQKDVEKVRFCGSGSQPKSALHCPSGSHVLESDPNRPIHSGFCASMPALIPGGMTVSVYPSFGTWPWMELAVPTGSFLQQPSVEILSSGLLSAVPGPCLWPSLMVPFRYPGYKQQSECLQDMHSRYGPAIASFNQINPNMCHNFSSVPMVPDLTGSWNARQCYNNQGSLVIGDHKSVPLDLAASKATWKTASIPCVERSSCPVKQLHKGLNGCKAESNTGSMGRSVQQGQQISLDGSDKSSVNAAVALCGKSKYGDQDVSEWVQSKNDINNDGKKTGQQAEMWAGHVIKVVPHAAVSASESTAGILLSIQQERQH